MYNQNSNEEVSNVKSFSDQYWEKMFENAKKRTDYCGKLMASYK